MDIKLKKSENDLKDEIENTKISESDKEEITEADENNALDNDLESKVHKDEAPIKVINKSSNENSYLRNLIAGIIVLILAGVTFLSYGTIKQLVKQDNCEIYSNTIGNSDVLYRYNVVLYKNYIMETNNNYSGYGDVFIDKYSNNNDFNEEANKKLSYNIDTWEKNITKDYKNLEYVMLDDENNKLSTSGDDALLEAYKNKELENLDKEYDWYEVIECDNMGDTKITTKNTSSTTRNYYNTNTLFSIVNDDYSKYFPSESVMENRTNEIKIKPVNNVTFVYGIKKDLQFKDNISQYATSEEYSIGGGNNQSIVNIIICIIVLSLIISFLIPYKYAARVFQGRILFKIPFEINMAVDISISCLICVMFFISMVVSINGDAYRYLDNNYNINEGTAFITIAIFNILFLFLVYNFIFAGVTYLKHIFVTGVTKYIKQNSLFFIVVRGFKNLFRKVLNLMLSIDFNSKIDRSIFKIVLINFALLVGMSLFFNFGFFVAIVYSIIIFFLIKNYVLDVRKKYQRLLNGINQIAEGNLNVNIDEDLGFFNPIKNQLKKIQSGLKKAVSKEVHSERMKTELISNVSHDLKTPLTSIITYTDLLKNSNPTDEERDKYIDTIDKKSKRLKALIEDLFDVSKATSGDIKLNKMNIDIIGLIKQTEIEYEDNFKKANLTVKNSFPNGKVMLNVDGEKTYRIFANLFGNAVKYSIPNSRVYVDVNNYFDRIEIVLKNTSNSEMNFNENEITERFVRGDKSRNTEGSGLGLAIAKSFTEIQNGRFNIKIDGDLFKVIIMFYK